MKNWTDYKKEYSEKSEQNAFEMSAIEEFADIISQYIQKREEMGFTQTEIAEISGIKQSALSRMESLKAVPQLDTVIKALKPLGLKLAIVQE